MYTSIRHNVIYLYKHSPGTMPYPAPLHRLPPHIVDPHPSYPSCPSDTTRLQLTPHLLLVGEQLLHLGKAVVELQALRVQQRAGRRDAFPGDDALDGEFDFLQVDCRLR